MNEKGERMNALHYSKEWLYVVKHSDSFYCPVCQGEVLLKIGEKMKPHFAHRKNQCLLQLERESPYHLHGKELLYNWLISQGKSVELEPYIRSIQQRPDLLLTSGQTKVALEYQCSVIPAEQFIKRTKSYWSEGIRVLWILGGNQFKRTGVQWLRTSSFHTLFTQQATPPSLLYFCPSSKAFFRCSPVIPFSSYQSYSHIQYLPLHTTRFSSIFIQSNIQLSQLKHEWNKKKRRWRENGLYSLFRSHSEFFLFLYERGIPPSLFPSEVAIPLPSLIGIHTPALFWQSFMLLEEIDRLQVGESFSIRKMYERLRARRRWKPRLLPYFPPTFPKLAFFEYASFLQEAGFLTQLAPQFYQKRSDIILPKTGEEALRRDEIAMKHALSLFTKHTLTSSKGKRI